jgi:triphosphoribosyl-dephospho-CoA synthetase
MTLDNARERQRLADTVISTAMWAMMSEAAVTPKPGLVDRANSGANKDMDFFTFINSASALLPWFRDCALAGFDSRDEGNVAHSPKVLFETLRPLGIKAEALMKKATGGVNVHRGYIFCLGVLSAAFGRLYLNTPDLTGIVEFSKAMTAALPEDFYSPIADGEISHGEAAYRQNGIQGIRGEVCRGFPSVTGRSLPLLRRLLKEGHSLNDSGVAILLNLMAVAEDTNIIHRGGIKTFRSIQEELGSFLAAAPDMEAIKNKACDMDREFILKNISPGGTADLLGVTFFLYRLTGG